MPRGLLTTICYYRRGVTYLALGIIREAFTCDYTVYPWTDVRGRQYVVRAFVDRLVATGMWSIVSEEVPTTNFTGSTTYYRIWIKFKNNEHYIRFQVVGGSLTTDVQINICKDGIVGTTYPLNYTTAIATGLGHQTLGYTQMGLCAVFGPTWMIVAPVSYALAYPVPATTGASCFAGFMLEDFVNPATTADVVVFLSSSGGPMLSTLYSPIFLPGDDLAKSNPAAAIPQTSPTTEIIVPSSGVASTNWRKIDIFNFSNSSIMAPVGTILSINGHYYIVAYANLIADLGAIP